MQHIWVTLHPSVLCLEPLEGRSSLELPVTPAGQLPGRPPAVGTGQYTWRHLLNSAQQDETDCNFQGWALASRRDTAWSHFEKSTRKAPSPQAPGKRNSWGNKKVTKLIAPRLKQLAEIQPNQPLQSLSSVSNQQQCSHLTSAQHLTKGLCKEYSFNKSWHRTGNQHARH